jgi:hypothetical protein
MAYVVLYNLRLRTIRGSTNPKIQDITRASLAFHHRSNLVESLGDGSLSFT